MITCDLETLPLRMKCHKGLIAHHTANAIIAIKNHVEVEHKTLLVKYLEHVINQLKSMHNQELRNKRSHFDPTTILGFLMLLIYFQKITS
jgi:hypothetical protein